MFHERQHQHRGPMPRECRQDLLTDLPRLGCPARLQLLNRRVHGLLECDGGHDANPDAKEIPTDEMKNNPPAQGVAVAK
jgi:hypothetical protein